MSRNYIRNISLDFVILCTQLGVFLLISDSLLLVLIQF